MEECNPINFGSLKMQGAYTWLKRKLKTITVRRSEEAK
jgi:hypothetical protein